MFYKVLLNEKIIDVLDSLIYVRETRKKGSLVSCPRAEASGIVSSDGNKVWHLAGYVPFTNKNYETVSVVRISEEEYHKLKMLNGKTPEEIIDEYTLSLIEGGLL